MLSFLLILISKHEAEAFSKDSADEVRLDYRRSISEKDTIPFFEKEDLVFNGSRKIYPNYLSYHQDGDAWSWERLEKAVDFASKRTGVRKEFLFGMLAVESDLGRNVGKCSYEEVEEGARVAYDRGVLSHSSWNNFQYRRSLVRGIAEELSYDYRNLKVSCNPANYIGTGGALGVGQFMPDTWLEYKERISSIVKKKNPDPWDLEDGIIAMALKLSDYPGVIEHDKWAENNAAKLYLSGTTSWRYNWYASLVQYWSINYRRLLV